MHWSLMWIHDPTDPKFYGMPSKEALRDTLTEITADALKGLQPIRARQSKVWEQTPHITADGLRCVSRKAATPMDGWYRHLTTLGRTRSQGPVPSCRMPSDSS